MFIIYMLCIYIFTSILHIHCYIRLYHPNLYFSSPPVLHPRFYTILSRRPGTMQTAGVALPIGHSSDGAMAVQLFGEIVRQDFKGLDTVNGLSFGIRINAPKAVMFN